MKTYVIVFAFAVEPGFDKVLLTLKDRPAWQKGRLNLPGGKVEEDEPIITAAVRELMEEAGLEQIGDYDPMVASEPQIMGHIVGGDSIIYCVRVDVSSRQALAPREGETEQVSWYDWHEIKNDRRLIPNLQLIIPLCRMGVRGWQIMDRSASSANRHVVQVSLYTGEEQ